MKKLILPLFTSIVLLFCLSACEKTLIGPEITDTPENNFDVLWQEYDRLYGTFEVKNIDWHALYKQYRPQVKPNATDQELFNVMTQLLKHLDDNHVYLRPLERTGIPAFNGGILGRRQFHDFDEKVLNTYLLERKIYGNDIVYGKLTPQIGFINLLSFSNDFNYYPKAMDKVLDELRDTKGIVIEMRNNGGGEDRVCQYIANRFASEKHISFTSRLRNGPKHSDFGPTLTFYTEPKGSFQFTKPVVVITGRHTFSSGDTFVLAMKQNKNVTMVGDSTGGAFPDAIRRELPNGWLFRVPIADVRDPNGVSWEGIGLAPDVLIKVKKEELEAGKDKALEKAIEILN